MGSQPVNRHDPRVLERAGDLSLQQEPLTTHDVVGVRVEDLFERHLPVQLDIQSDKDSTSPPARGGG